MNVLTTLTCVVLSGVLFSEIPSQRPFSAFQPTSNQSSSIVSIAYNRNIRNAIAHSQYHYIQGGIWYDNFGCDKYADLQAIGFDDWEQKYCMTYFLFIGIFKTLKQIKDEFYLPLSKTLYDKGIPIRIPDKNGTCIEKYIYPNQDGETWRSVRT